MAGPVKENVAVSETSKRGPKPTRIEIPRGFLAYYLNANATNSTDIDTATTPILPQQIDSSSSTLMITLDIELEQPLLPRLSNFDSQDLVDIPEEELGPTSGDDEVDDGDSDGEPADNFEDSTMHGDVAPEEDSLDESASQLRPQS